MKTSKRLSAALCLCLAGTIFTHAQPRPDLVIFDENDSIGPTYYDASFAYANPPSLITASGPGSDKLPILTGQAMTGENAGLLEWHSRPGGDWMFFVASPGWQTRNAAGYSNLVLHLNGPAAIPSAALPRIGLESSTNIRTPDIALSAYFEEGLDEDETTWQQVTIPLDAFQPYGAFQLAQFKAIYLRQDPNDDVLRTLWIDNIRVTADGQDPGGPPPGEPTQLVTRVGDRSIVLHWDRNPEPDVTGYHVYRAEDPAGPFTKHSPMPLTSPSYADLSVQNDVPYHYRVTALNARNQESSPSEILGAAARPFAHDDEFLEYLQQTAFDYFWYEANPDNGLVRDRSQPYSSASIAATGFGLTAIAIAIERGWISRQAGRQRVATTLRTFWEQPQGNAPTGHIGYRGWFYHFLEMDSATRSGSSELSSIDTALFLAGMLDAKQFFDGDDPEEIEIRTLADAIFERVDWHWMIGQPGAGSLTMGWMPESGFLGARWIGYNEAMILYLLGMGAPNNPLPPEHWISWTSGYRWATHHGHSFVPFPPLFGHQYSHLWVDFRHIADPYMLERGITYFENSRRATLAQRAYCIVNPGGFAGYSDLVWGLTACDGPGTTGFFSYIARGAPPAENDDGTIAPTAVGGSLPFAPEHCLPTLRHFYDEFRADIWTGYGFRDAFNIEAGWWAPDILGIDQGPILIMAENYRSQAVWHRFMREPIVQRGLAAAGFVRLSAVAPSLHLTPDRTTATLTWAAEPDRAYQVEYSPDLFHWFITTAGLVSPIGSVATWIDAGPPATANSPANAPSRYYRAVQFGTP